MRILFILASPGAGGAETQVRHLCAELAARGQPCHVAFLTDAKAVGNATGYEEEFLAELSARGVGYTILARKWRDLPGSARRLRAAAAEFRPELVHSHVARGLISAFLARLRLPTVYTHHSVTANFPHWVFRLLDRGVDQYVAVSRACRDFLTRHVRAPIQLIPNGVPVGLARAPGRTGPADDPFILSVGTLRPPKDYPTLIAAARLLVPRFAEVGRRIRFAIAGEGESRTSLQQLIDRAGLAERFELLGARRDVQELMDSADLLVNSSVREGLPVTLIEAAAAGLPAIVTDVGGSPEIVADGVTGCVVPPGRPDLLADAIFELLQDKARYAAFSLQTRLVAENFTLAPCADAHVALYERILAGPSGRKVIPDLPQI